MDSSQLIIEKAHFCYEGNTVSATPLELKDIPVALENPDADLLWYTKYFVHENHTNYVGKDDSLGYIAVMTVLENAKAPSQQYRVILATKKKNFRVIIPSKKKLGLSDLLKGVDPSYAGLAKKLVRVTNKKMYKELLAIENMEVNDKYKFGMLLCLEGQTLEEDMFSNQGPNQNFTDFLDCLGDKIAVKGWKKYKAGLDTSFGGTGDHSYYTTLGDIEIMFHVTTLLPFTAFNKQQLQRKRQCGNDVIQIIFVDGKETPFDPECIASQFNHVWVVVQPLTFDANGRAKSYRVAVARKNSVPFFGPALPSPAVFRRGQELRDFLLTKFVNGERSCMQSEIFIQLTERTKDIMLMNLHDTFTAERTSSKAEEAKILQGLEKAMKRKPMSTIKSADILASTPLLEVSGAVLSADTCGDSLVFGTSTGISTWKEGAVGATEVLKADAVKHLCAVQEHGVVVYVAGKKRELYVVDTEGLLRAAGKPRALGVKRVTRFAVAPSGDYVALAHGRGLVVFRWMGKSYERVYEDNLPADCLVLSFYDNLLVAGLRHEFDIIDLATSELTLLHREEKLAPVSMAVVGERLLLCFGHHAVFVDVHTSAASALEVVEWSQAPSAMVSFTPYVLGVDRQGISAVSTVSSRLIQAVPFKDTQFHSAKDSGVLLSSHGGSSTTFYNVSMAQRDGYTTDRAMLTETSRQVGGSIAVLNGASVESTNTEATEVDVAFYEGLRQAVAELEDVL